MVSLFNWFRSALLRARTRFDLWRWRDTPVDEDIAEEHVSELDKAARRWEGQ